jgi:hypothetical protein
MDLAGYGNNAPNVVITRPADSRVFGGVDTWGKDCSSPGAGDGTGISAGFMNGMLAQYRALVRGNGQTAALSNVVTEDNSDDTMALKAIQHLIQRGQARFAVDSGAADALVVAMTPALAEYKVGTSLKVLVAHDGAGAPATINCNGLGTRPIVRKGGAPLQRRDMLGGAIHTFDYDGASFQLDMPAAFSNASLLVTSSAVLNLTLQHRAIALFRTVSPAPQNINLPAGAGSGQTIIIEDVAGNMHDCPVDVYAPAGESIGQAALYHMNQNFQSTTFRFYTDGTIRIWSRS